MAISHVFTNPIPDGTNTNIVRPSDWNSAHNQYYTLSGNTLGASTVSGTNVVLQAAGNVSLSGTGGTIVVYGTGGGVAVSAGTQSASSGTVVLSNSNGVSFGLNNGTLTASVPSVSALSNGNNITISNTGSNVGISAQAVAVGAGTQTATSGTVNFVNSNGVTFGMSGSNQITASVAAPGGAGNFNLSGATSGNTTATGNTINLSGINITLSGTNGSQIAISAPATSSLSAGNNISLSSNGSTIGLSALAIGLNTAATNVTWTANSSGLSINAAGYAGTGFSSTTTAGTAIVGTNNSNGLSLGVPAYLTTQSVQTQASGNIARTGFTSTTTAGTAVVGTLNTGGLSLGVPAYLTTQSVQTQASGNIAGSGFTGVNATGTLNSNGLSLSVAAPGAANYSIGVSNLGNTAGSTGITGTRIVFVGTNNISLSQSTDANGATISINQTGGGGGGAALSAGTQSVSTGTVNFANSNGISFGMSGSNQITASYTVPTVPTSYVSNVNGSSGQISLNVGSSLSSSTNGSSITFGLASNITTALQSANANYLTSQSNQAFSASGGSSTFQTLNFANSNGVTFSNSGGSVVASHNGITSQSVQTQASGAIAGTGFTSTTTAGTAITAVLGTNGLSMAVPAYLTAAAGGAGNFNLSGATSGNTTASGSTINLSGINITLSGTNGSQIAISAPATSSLSAGNNISLSSNGSTIGLSALAVGLNTAATNVTWTVNSSGISLNAAGYAGTGTSATNASITLNSAGLAISVAAPGGGGAGNFNLSGATSGNTTASGSTINLSGINVTLSGTNGSQIAISAPATSSLSAGNNFSISTNGSTIILSARAAALGAGTQTALSGTVNFANSNGITFGMSGSSQITASYTVPLTTGFAGTGFTSTTVTGTAVQGTLSTNGLSLAVPAYLTAAVGGGGIAAAAGTQTATSGTVNFANSNGITFGMSGSSQITASHNGITTQTVQTQASGNIAGAGFTSTTTAGTVIVGTNNSNGLSLGVPAYLTTQTVQTQASGNIAGTGFTSTTTAGTVIVGTLNTGGLSLGVPAYLTTQTVQTQASGNIAGSGFTGVNATGTLNSNGLSLSVAAPGGGGAINVSAGTTSNNLQTIVFSNGNDVSFGLNGSTVTASVAPQYTLSGYNHYNDVVMSAGTVGQGALIFDHIDLENAVQFDRYGMLILNTNSSNSSGSHTISFWIGLYTQNVSTISLLQSTSTSVNVSQSGTVGSYSLFSGIRQLTIPFTTTLARGEYFLGVVSRSTSAGANGSYSQMRQSNFNSDYRGLWGSAVNATNQVFPGMGLYSATTSGLPGSIAFSQINGTNADALRPPVVIFQSGTY